jgi:hypothetical protein
VPDHRQQALGGRGRAAADPEDDRELQRPDQQPLGVERERHVGIRVVDVSVLMILAYAGPATVSGSMPGCSVPRWARRR